MEKVLAEGAWVQLVSPILVAILGVITYYVRKYINKLLEKSKLEDAEKEAIDALLQGMAEQQPIANGIKKAAADGKITKEEAKQLEMAAWNVAKEVATGPAKDIVINWTSRKVASLVKQLLAKYKGKKNG